MEGITIKHPFLGEIPITRIELFIIGGKGTDIKIDNETVQVLIDKIKQQHQKIIELEGVIAWQDEDISNLNAELEKNKNK